VPVKMAFWTQGAKKSQNKVEVLTLLDLKLITKL
jgi:hypothetical protein